MATEKAAMAVIKATRPDFRKHHDKVAFAIHASFLAAGFSLAATGRNAFSDDLPRCEEEVGIAGWNELEDSYGFLYFKKDKAAKKRVLVKCHAIGDLLAVDALNLDGEQKEPFHLKINLKDYLIESADQPRNYEELFKNFNDLVKVLNSSILEKLEDESLYSVATDTAAKLKVGSTSTAHSQERREPSNTEPVTVTPDDVHEPSSLVYPPIMPLDYNDAFPGPGAGFYPERAVGRGGDMLVGPNDPRFFPSRVRPGFPGDLTGVPPGARFDPIGPPGVPGFEPARFARRGRNPEGSTHPDLEFFQQGPDFI